MHIWSQDQRRPKGSRSAGEKLLKRLNLAVLVVQLGCLLVVISQVSIACGKTFAMDFWFPRDFQLHELIETKTRNCSMEVSTDIMFKNVPQEVSVYDREFRFASLAARVKEAVITNCINVAISALNKALFDLNFYERSIRHVVIRKELVTVLEIAYIIFSFIATLVVLPEADVLRQYLRHCGVDAQTSLPFTPSFAPLWAALALQMYVHVMSFIVLLRNSCKKVNPTAEPEFTDAPRQLEGPPPHRFNSEVPVDDGTGGDYYGSAWRYRIPAGE